RQPGVDLLALAREGAGDPARRAWFHYTRRKQVGLREPGTHFVTTVSRTSFGLRKGTTPDGGTRWSFTTYEAGRSLLFDLERDPLCLTDLAPDRPERVERLLATLEEWGAAMTERRAILRDMSREEIERLEALGYGGDEEQPQAAETAAD
ncbi:MAG: hypothetical protein O7B99_02280, partial [Planctomycetota bacterium]|nr:hypothetical protein [Planctomycetota bacterium]